MTGNTHTSGHAATSKLNPGVEEHLDANREQPMGSSGKTIIVTKQGEEGGFEIDAFSGVVINPNELPEWAKGHTNALLAERHIFYSSRLGNLYTDAMKSADALAYEDLAWLVVSELEEPIQNPETGLMEHVETNQLDADHEFRMGIIAEVTGIAGDVDLEEGTFGADAITKAIVADNMRSQEELDAMDKAAQEGFKGTASSGS